MTEFLLDHRLQDDCLDVCDLELCRVLLMNDARWPWLILVPKIKNGVEIHDLSLELQTLLQRETSICAQSLMQVCGCEKINSGALGNIVRQLHVHVIGRSVGDSNWPGPVWGFENCIPYENSTGEQLAKKLACKLSGQLAKSGMKNDD